jgi:hypothetical protein
MRLAIPYNRNAELKKKYGLRWNPAVKESGKGRGSGDHEWLRNSLRRVANSFALLSAGSMTHSFKFASNRSVLS